MELNTTLIQPAMYNIRCLFLTNDGENYFINPNAPMELQDILQTIKESDYPDLTTYTKHQMKDLLFKTAAFFVGGYLNITDTMFDLGSQYADVHSFRIKLTNKRGKIQLDRITARLSKNSEVKDIMEVIEYLKHCMYKWNAIIYTMYPRPEDDEDLRKELYKYAGNAAMQIKWN